MSSLQQRRDASVARLPEDVIFSLEDQLAHIGVTTLDDVFVAWAMRAAAVRLSPDTYRHIIVVYELFRTKENWRPFTLDQYLEYHYKAMRGDIAEYGAPIPPAVEKRIDKVRQHMPGATIEIFALRIDDPYVRVHKDGQSKWIGGWYGRNATQRVF